MSSKIKNKIKSIASADAKSKKALILANIDEIQDLINEGYSRKLIWSATTQSIDIEITYPGFCKIIREYNAPVSSISKTKPTRETPTPIIKPKSRNDEIRDKLEENLGAEPPSIKPKKTDDYF